MARRSGRAYRSGPENRVCPMGMEFESTPSPPNSGELTDQGSDLPAKKWEPKGLRFEYATLRQNRACQLGHNAPYWFCRW